MGGSRVRRTYGELEDASNRVAQLLRSAGLRTGDHVAVLLTNRVEWYDVVWGALRAGLYVTPVNFHLTAAEAGYIARDSGARALFADAELADTVAAMGDDLGAVGLRVAVGGHLVGLYGFSTDTEYLSPAPLYHAAPAGWTTMTQRLGGTAIVMERFHPEDWLALVERHGVTHSQVVPTHLVRLLKLPEEVRRRYD